MLRGIRRVSAVTRLRDITGLALFLEFHVERGDFAVGDAARLAKCRLDQFMDSNQHLVAPVSHFRDANVHACFVGPVISDSFVILIPMWDCLDDDSHLYPSMTGADIFRLAIIAVIGPIAASWVRLLASNYAGRHGRCACGPISGLRQVVFCPGCDRGEIAQQLHAGARLLIERRG